VSQERGKHVIDIARAVQIRDIMIRAVLKNAQETDTEALFKPFEYEN
jgi:hypothetical protein